MTHTIYIRCSELPETGIHGLTLDELFEAAMKSLITAYLPRAKYERGYKFWLCEKRPGSKEAGIVNQLFFEPGYLLPLHPKMISKMYFNGHYDVQTFPYSNDDGRDLFIYPENSDGSNLGIRISRSDIVYLKEDVERLAANLRDQSINFPSDELPYLLPVKMDEGAKAIWQTILILHREGIHKPAPKQLWKRLISKTERGTLEKFGLTYIESEDRIQTIYDGQQEFLTYNSVKQRVNTWHNNYKANKAEQTLACVV